MKHAVKEFGRRCLTSVLALALCIAVMQGVEVKAYAAITKATAPFTYTGSWDIVEYDTGKWVARLLSSGTFTPKSNLVVDVFVVGGGAGGRAGNSSTRGGMGGGGGYTKTVKNITVSSGVSVTVGAGGGSSANGGASSFGSNTANGGQSTSGNGGSGGGMYSNGSSGSSGGTVCGAGGANGSAGGTINGAGGGGTGQGTNTYAFGADRAPFNTSTWLYSGGGGGGGGVTHPSNGSLRWGIGGAGGAGGGGAGATGNGNNSAPAAGSAGAANRGGGGGGGAVGAKDKSGGVEMNYFSSGGSGGSGIVLVRNVDTPPLAPTPLNVPATIKYGVPYNVTWPETTTTSTTSYVSGYALERQKDGGTWEQVYTVGVGGNLSFTDVWARGALNTVNYRVRAYSNTGLYSGYTTSTARSVINNVNPTAVTVSVTPSIVNGWEAPKLAVKWTQSTDDDGDSITYGVDYAVNGGATWTTVATGVAAYEYNVNIPTGRPDSIQFRVRAIDSYGGASAYSTSNTVTIVQDRTAPVGTSWKSTPNVGAGIWVNRDVKIDVIAGVDTQSGLKQTEWRIGGGAYTVGSSFTISSTGLIGVRSVDNEGNASADVAVQVNIDKIAPSSPTAINMGDKEAHGNLATTIKLSGGADTGGSGFKGYCYKTKSMVDWVEIVGTTVLVSEHGTSSFASLDYAGNMSNVVELFIELDITPPTMPVFTVIGVTSGAVNLEWYTEDVTIQALSFDYQSGISGYRVWVNGNEVSNIDGKIILRLADFITGKVSIRVTASDKAGNISEDGILKVGLDSDEVQIAYAKCA